MRDESDPEAPLSQQMSALEMARWISILRRRSHDAGNKISEVEGQVIAQALRLDEALKDQARAEAREELRQTETRQVGAWQNRIIGAVAVIAFLFPITVGVIVTTLKTS